MSDSGEMVLTAILALAAGFCFGALYFTLLWRAVGRLLGGAAGWRFAFALVLRLGLVLAALAALVWSGGGLPVILAATLGVALSRLLATRFARAGIAKE
jgi:F1F0 ATPase subunit 2